MSDDSVETKPFDPAVPSLSQAISLGGLLATAILLFVVPPAATAALVAVALVALAFSRRHRVLFNVGIGVGILGVLLAGTADTAPVVVLLASATLFVAYDVGETALSLGEQMGQHARTRRLELTRAAIASLAASTVTALVYASYLIVGGAASAGTVALVLVGVVIAVVALR